MGRLLPVAGNWGSVLAKLIPLALVVALSPITVIPAVLVMHAPRPRPASMAFLGGWLVGLAALTAVFVGASDLLGDLHKRPPTWVDGLRVVLGSALIAFGIFLWRLDKRCGLHRYRRINGRDPDLGLHRCRWPARR